MMNLSMHTEAVALTDPMTTAVPELQGADMSPGAWGKQVVTRLGNPPLRFIGRRLCYHWRSFSLEQRIEVAVWERRQKGYVLGFSQLKGPEVRADAANLKTFGDAADFLEDICVAEPALQSPQDQLFDLLSGLHCKLRFRQQFAILVGDVLADWDAMPAAHLDTPRHKEPFQ